MTLSKNLFEFFPKIVENARWKLDGCTRPILLVDYSILTTHGFW